MAVKKVKKTNKNSKFLKVTRVLNFSTTKGKFLVFMLTFAVIGGGFAAYQAFAATYPADFYTASQVKTNVKAADGQVATMQCRSVAGKTGYGTLAQCVQIKSGSNQYRTGLYSVEGRVFNQSSGWLSLSTSNFNGNSADKCTNMDYYFAAVNGPYALKTGYGPLDYGQIYRRVQVSATTWKWQIKWAQMGRGNTNKYTCYLISEVWMDAIRLNIE